MIDPVVLSNALGRISTRAQDVRNAYQSGFEPQREDTALSGSPRIEPSLDPLSVVAPEGAYFLVGDESGGRRYSRDGAFSMRDGTLRASDGLPVLGKGPQGEAIGALRVDPVDNALGRASQVRIEPDGVVCYSREAIDPRTGKRRTERVVIGRLALARFPAGTLPMRIDHTHVSAPPGVTPYIGSPADGHFPMLATHARDIGRMDVNAGLARLQEAYLSFEALRSARNAGDGLTKTAMDLLK